MPVDSIDDGMVCLGGDKNMREEPTLRACGYMEWLVWNDWSLDGAKNKLPKMDEVKRGSGGLTGSSGL